MRDVLGDLAVTIVELRRQPPPAYERSRLQTFANWYRFGERLFHQLIATGLAVAHARQPPSAEDYVPLAAALEDASVVAELMEQSCVAFEYIGYEEGFLYGGASWRPLCEWRSAARFLEELARAAQSEFAIDMTATDEGLLQWGDEIYEPVQIPEGMPATHWWWFSAAPR